MSTKAARKWSQRAAEEECPEVGGTHGINCSWVSEESEPNTSCIRVFKQSKLVEISNNHPNSESSNETEGAITDRYDEAIQYNWFVHRVVASVGGHDSEADTQSQEDLACCI
jgi:hypothetical protein